MACASTESCSSAKAIGTSLGTKGDCGMRFVETGIAGAKVIDPSPHEDGRGRFMRAWCIREFTENGLDFLPVQANMGFSVRKGTVRGMHFQVLPALEAKLVRCT